MQQQQSYNIYIAFINPNISLSNFSSKIINPKKKKGKNLKGKGTILDDSFD